jgi:hypothetical protein
MPWEFDEQMKKKYWMPEVLPKSTPEHNNAQFNKMYLNLENKEVVHPKWYFSNTALVTDDYLFYNEGMRYIRDGAIAKKSGYRIVEDSPDCWIINTDNTITRTYSYIKLTEKDYQDRIDEKLNYIRSKRLVLLMETDYVIVQAMESGLNVSQEFKIWRQYLRDLPLLQEETHAKWVEEYEYNPEKFDSLLESKPTKLFE